MQAGQWQGPALLLHQLARCGIVEGTLGNLLTLKVTAANEQEHSQVADLAKQVLALARLPHPAAEQMRI